MKLNVIYLVYAWSLFWYTFQMDLDGNKTLLQLFDKLGSNLSLFGLSFLLRQELRIRMNNVTFTCDNTLL